jgi:hypothetical protein
MIVTLENEHGDPVENCVIYYKSNAIGVINGKPWLFRIPYNQIGIWRYETWVLSNRPEYPLWNEVKELNTSTGTNLALEEELQVR